jgi:DNA-binding NarL/FixJ family response regulator
MPVRILIADDNASVRAAMRDVLEGTVDWEIIEAENGEEAIYKARELMPQLIILDLVMPRKDGLTASREIKKILPQTPILMHTLYYSPKMEVEAAKTGVRKIVPKSEAAALVSAVREALQAQSEDGASGGTASQSAEKTELEARIRELCAQILMAKEDRLLEGVLVELRQALHEHIEGVRDRLAAFRGAVEKDESGAEAGAEKRRSIRRRSAGR